MDTQPPVFLTSILDRYTTGPAPHARPNVTLTLAESLDGKIAGKDGKQLILSGKQSMIMTHWMRTMHDAILVGIGTALNDNPQLNTRHLPPRDPSVTGHDKPYHLPRPVVLDTHLRLSPQCKLLTNFQNGSGRRPWIIAARPNDQQELAKWTRRSDLLEGAGAKIIAVTAEEGNQDLLPIRSILHKLHELGIHSLMVEGGARVIQSFFAETTPRHPTNANIDTIIVTVAPKTVGEDGVGYGMQLDLGENLPGFKHAASEKFGDDTVYAWIANGGFHIH